MLWLEYATSDMNAVPLNNGAVVQEENYENLATALHVAQGCT